MKLYQFIFRNLIWVIEPQEINHKDRKLWHICQSCNHCGKDLYKKFPIYALNVIGLNDQDVRSSFSGLAEFCINKHFKFDYTNNTEKELVCTGLDVRMMTHLLDL